MTMIFHRIKAGLAYFRKLGKRMSDFLLSICISSYNHGDKCVQLVNHILSVRDERYNIVICDDCSNEDTVSKLETLSDSKVKLIRNKHNLGPCKNWFKTIDNGNGRYMLHVLDRDVISINYLPAVLDILERNSVGGGYFGRSALYPVKEMVKRGNYAVCNKGREAFLTMAGVPIHPTGFFVQRTMWKNGNYKKYFYQSKKYGIYPHSYVLGELAINSKLIYSPIPFYSYIYRGSNKISRFYENSDNRDYWWLPHNTISTDNRLMLYLNRIADESYKVEFICRRFRDALNRATFTYKRVVANQQEMEHYGLHSRYVSGCELLRISVKYKMEFIQVLKKLEIDRNVIQKQLKEIWFENMEAILKEIREKNVDRVLSLCNINITQFQIMNQWVKVKQKKNNLSVYFEERGYYHIAIYGMGIIGQTLLDELHNTKVEVVYGIDRNAYKIYAEVKVISLEDSFPKVDAVVVTIVESFDKIVQCLKDKIDCPIISLKDIVYDMELV